MSFPEIQFLPPGATAGPLPSTDRLADPGFNCIDFAGYGSTNTRMKLAASPADPSRLACFIDLRDGDVAGHWGGHRAEMWRHPHDLAEGEESWHAWSWWLPDTFQPASAWTELGQLHSGDGGSPVQSLECLPDGRLNFSIRGGPKTTLGAAPRKTPIHVLLNVVHSADPSKGRVRFWLTTDSAPNPSFPPTVAWSGTTLIGGNSWTKVGLYSSGGAQQAWLLGFGRAATAARALELAGATAAAPAPTPPATITGSIKDGSTLTGNVVWTADNGPCGFWIDGAVKWSENIAPYVFGGDGKTLDTKTLTDGLHRFAVRLNASGAVHEVSATVKNAVAPPPTTDPVQAKIDAITTATVIKAAIQAVYDYAKAKP